MRAGATVIEVTPAAGLPMSGYAARESPATGKHDALTVRAVAVDDTALIAVDVVGLHEETCAQICRRCPLPDDHVIVHATHTHSGPASMPGRLGHEPDPEWLETLVEACIRSVHVAMRRQVPVTLRAGYAEPPDVARNRRRAGGPVDDRMPVAWFVSERSDVVAVVLSYACHPVVLGPDNTLWTADYPGVARTELESRYPGSVAVFATGCAGDANTGHPVHAATAMSAVDSRTFDEANRIGGILAKNAMEADCYPAVGEVSAAGEHVGLDFDILPVEDRWRSVTQWEAELETGCTSARARLLRNWIGWAQSDVFTYAAWTGPVTLLRWADVWLTALPGEPFAAAAAFIRAGVGPENVMFVLGYSGGCPGYLPAYQEYELGGYEVTEAHRFYGLPGAFAPGSLERLVDRALALATATESGVKS